MAEDETSGASIEDGRRMRNAERGTRNVRSEDGGSMIENGAMGFAT
jgi:hypothetical protein